MDSPLATTPFGRRSLSLAQISGQVAAAARDPALSINKWTVFRDLCVARARLGVSERSLSVLNALLSFFPDTELTGDELVVFPSNEQLSLRAHGMPASSLRRHLAALVEGGLIVRRDSPNGKRYVRRDRGGEVQQAFGFDLAPLVSRSGEWAAMADAVRAEEREIRRLKEIITICRRDCAKMIEAIAEEHVSIPALPVMWAGHASSVVGLRALYQAILACLGRKPDRMTLDAVACDLRGFSAFLYKALENHLKTQDSSANESHIERHIQNSKPDSHLESEPALEESKVAPPADQDPPALATRGETKTASLPLGLVLKACPEILNYAPGGIRSWAELVETAQLIRPMLGISPDAWRAAGEAMGPVDAAITLASILQRLETVKSPGGYLRALAGRAKAGHYSCGPVIMSLLRAVKQE